MTSIAVVLIPEATASTLLSIYDVFHLFAKVLPEQTPFDVTIVATHLEPITTSSGIPLRALQCLDAIQAADVVIVPSLALPDDRWQTGRYPELVNWIKKQHEAGAIICSACSGIFLLMETGLFDEVPVTCHWAFGRNFRATFPKARLCIEKTLVISGEDNRLLMSGASSSWHDLALYLINRFRGPSAASNAAKFFLLSWHPEGQAPYTRFLEPTDHGDAVIASAQAWLRDNWKASSALENMIKRSGLPERSFIRRFKNATALTPIDYLQHLRIEQAKRRLENTTMAVDDIAALVGYENPAFFRKLFKRVTTLTPSAYRMKFRSPAYLSA